MANRITICMGSSCHARGNRDNVRIIKDYLKARNLDSSVEFSGSLCEGRCSEGPVITINGKTYFSVEPSLLLDILNSELER